MRHGWLGFWPYCLAILSVAKAALARAPETTPRPIPRPDIALAPVMVASSGPMSTRPRVRPPSERDIAMAALDPAYAGIEIGASPKPFFRPKDLFERVTAKRREREEGSVCGNVAIQGGVVGKVPSRIRGRGLYAEGWRGDRGVERLVARVFA